GLMALHARGVVDQPCRRKRRVAATGRRPSIANGPHRADQHDQEGERSAGDEKQTTPARRKWLGRSHRGSWRNLPGTGSSSRTAFDTLARHAPSVARDRQNLMLTPMMGPCNTRSTLLLLPVLV